MHTTDLRAWKPMSAHQIPPNVVLTVLASDPWTGNAWVGWHDENLEPCRAMVHEAQLEYADEPFKRRARRVES